MATQPTFFERYRTPIIAGVAVIGVLVIGYFLFFGNQGPRGTFAATGPKYACDTLLTPGPSETLPPPARSFAATPTPLPTATPSPAASPSAAASVGSPAPSPSAAPSESAAPSASAGASAGASPSATPTPAPTLKLGFGTQILGWNHIGNPNQTIEYGFCPPTSGDHYNVSGFGPIRAAVYPNSAEQPPGGWVHNLEHGWVVLLYSCKNGCPSADEMAQLQSWYDQAPTPDPSQGCDKEVLVARFDSMTTRFAELAWGRALLSDQFDLETAKTFTQQWMDSGTERETTIC